MKRDHLAIAVVILVSIGAGIAWWRLFDPRRKTIVAEKARREASEAAQAGLLGLDSDLARGMSPIARMDKLRALGPPACEALLLRFESPGVEAQKKRIYHQLLIDLRGQDLGADAAAWRKWCAEVTRPSP